MGNASKNVAAINAPKKQKYSIIIPVAGLGQRMKSYGPKSLIKINDATILEHQLAKIHATFIQYEIILVTGFESEKIARHAKDKNVKIVVNKHFEETNVVHSIALGLIAAKYKNVLIIYGDLVFNKDAITLPLMNESLISIDPSDFMKKDEVGCTIQQNLLVNMMYGLPNKWGQMMFLTGKELELFKSIVTTQKCARWFGFEMINEIMKQGGKFRAFTPKNAASIDVDTSKDIIRAQEICAL